MCPLKDDGRFLTFSVKVRPRQLSRIRILRTATLQDNRKILARNFGKSFEFPNAKKKKQTDGFKKDLTALPPRQFFHVYIISK